MENKAEITVGAEGRPSRAVGLLMDMTSQHEARKSVEEGWRQYKTLVSALSSIEWRSTADGKILCSKCWQELTGQSPAESEGWGWINAVHLDDRENMRLRWIASIAAKTVYAVDFRARCADGRYRWFLARAAPVFHQDGSVREWFGAFVAAASYNPLTAEPAYRPVSILEASHIRAARALLRWTIKDLAARANVSISSVRRLEMEEGNNVRSHVQRSVHAALEANGVSFNADKPGEIMLHLKTVF